MLTRTAASAVSAIALIGIHTVNAKTEALSELESLEFTSKSKKIFTPYVTYSFDHYENVSGGFEAGGTSAGLVDLGFDLDLESLFGWQGTTFTVNAFAPHGNDFSGDRVGDFGVISNNFADTEFNLFRIQIVKEWGDSGNFVKFGQIAADDDFLGIPTADLFIHSAFAPFNTQSGNTLTPIFPLAAPGALLHLQPSDNFSFTTAIYTGFAGEGGSSNRGFDWEFGRGDGYALFAEADYTYGAGTITLGGFYHTGEFEEFATGDTVRGLSALWAAIDHTLVDGEANGGPTLDLFARASIAPQFDRSVATYSFDGGLVLSDLFAPGHTLGLGCTFTAFGDDFLAGSADAGVTDTETVIELTYFLPIHENFSLQPDIQYIIDPHFSGEDSLVIGMRSQITF